MNILETEWWLIGIPPEWWAEQEEDSIVIGDRDDVGNIEISTLRKEAGVFDAEEVRQLARQNSEGDWDWQSAQCGVFSGCSCRYEDGDAAVREWYLARDSVLLFITYACAAENRGMDDAAVDEILDTLASAGAS